MASEPQGRFLPPTSGDPEVDEAMAIIEAEHGPEAARGEPSIGTFTPPSEKTGGRFILPGVSRSEPVPTSRSAIPYADFLPSSIRQIFEAPGRVVGEVAQDWEEGVTKPVIKQSFKEDPRETIRKRGVEKGIKPLQPGMTSAEVSESLVQGTKEFATDVLADPLTALLGNPLMRGARTGRVPAPREMTPPHIVETPKPIPEAIPYTAPGMRVEGTGRFIEPATPVGEPSITDLARGEQARQLEPHIADYQPALPDLPGNVPPKYEVGPGFARLGEETVTGAQTFPPTSQVLHGAESPAIRAVRSFTQEGVSEAATRGASEGALQAQRRLQIKSITDKLTKRLLSPEKLTAEEQLFLEQEWQAGRLTRLRQAIPKTSGDSPIEKYFTTGKMPDVVDYNPAHTSAKYMAPVHEALSSMGEVGRAIAWTDLVYVRDVAEQFAMRDLIALDKNFTKWFGDAPLIKRGVPWELHDSTRVYNVTRKDLDEWIDYAYTMDGEHGPVLYPTNPKVKGSVEEAMQHLMENLSTHPGVRQAKVRQPDGSLIPVGQPKAVYPHNPIDAALQEGLSGRALEYSYRQAKKRNPTLTLENYKLDLFRSKQQYPRYAGLEMARTLDATDGGTRRPSQVLRELGYGTDPLRDMTSLSYGAYLRGQQILAEPDMRRMLTGLMEAAARTGTEAEATWVQKVGEHLMGMDREFPDRVFSGLVTNANNLVNVLSLHRSAIQQFQQLSYTFSRFGMGNTLKAIFSLPKDIQQQIVNQSAANFATYLQMLQPNPSRLGQVLQRELQMVGMTRADSWGRLVAAQAADNTLSHLDTMFRRYVGSGGVTPELERVYRARLGEGGFSPKQVDRILANGLTFEDRVQWAKRGADMTQGRAGVTGIPYFMSEWRQNPGAGGAIARLWSNLRTFQFANMGEVTRLIKDARYKGIPPSEIRGRIARLMIAGTVLGEAATDMAYGVLYGENPFTNERTPKWMREMMGNVTGRAVHDLVNGVGLLQSVLVMAFIQSTDQLMDSLVYPVAASKAMDVKAAVWKAIENGNWEPLQRLIMRSTVGTEAPMGKRKTERGSGMPQLPKVGVGGGE